MAQTAVDLMNKTKQIGGWRLIKRIGSGGNANVYRASKDGKSAALKVLRHQTPKMLERFRDEVKAMQLCSDIAGVLPIIEFRITDSLTRGHAWLAMSLATPIQRALKQSRLGTVVSAVRDIAQVLAQMHARGISHRDVKPENLFNHSGQWAVGDLGLAHFQGKLAHTQSRERIGAVYYIAPEMLNAASVSNGAAADVFSLAKVLWVLGTGQRFPLPGPHNRQDIAHRIGTYVPHSRAQELDTLIAAATLSDTNSRISMARFVQELDAWLRPAEALTYPIGLDISEYADALQRRSVEFESSQQRQMELQEGRNAIGLRIRELLRPFAADMETTLRRAHFNPVSLNIDNHHYGFELYASIPDVEGRHTRLSIHVGIGAANPDVTITASFKLEVLSEARLNAAMRLWSTSRVFIEGGSQEQLELGRLKRDMGNELQSAVATAARMAINGPASVIGYSTARAIWIFGPSGPTPNADVVLVGADGTYLQSATNQNGEATFGENAFRPAMIFTAHRDYSATCTVITPTTNRVELSAADQTGSIVALRGWTSLPGLTGKADFIHDRHGSLYVYVDNMSVNGSYAQPYHLQVGQPFRLREPDGSALTLLVKAVQGPCFLVDLIR